MKDEFLWTLAVRKPVGWFLRRFLSPDEVERALAAVEDLIRATLAK